MTILNGNSPATGRHPAATTLLFGTIGFLGGFILSLLVSAYSLYACIQVM
jgi:hypothetical protein